MSDFETCPVGTGKLVTRLQDAMDHIWRIANMSHQMTKRTYWISARARSALDGDEKWREFDYPKNRKREREHLRANLRRMRKAIDDIYNHSDECREAVVEHYGTYHIPALTHYDEVKTDE